MNLIIEHWTKEKYDEFLGHLKTFLDEDYRKFHSHLIPDFPYERLIGIRTPILRKMGKEISKGNCESFLSVAGSYYYEEIVLRAIVSGLIKTDSYEKLEALIDAYSPLVDNWATCDLFCSSIKEVKRYRNELLVKIKSYLSSENPWFVRIGIVILLNYYLDDFFISDALSLIDNIKSDFYYISMAQAWLVATAFAKNPDITMEYFKNCKLNDITFNRAIQKAKDSYRINKELKLKLSKMKRTLDKHNS